jgi:hypothetical protein
MARKSHSRVIRTLHSTFPNAAQTDPSQAASRGCVRYLYELPKVVLNSKAYYLDHRLEELRGVRVNRTGFAGGLNS